MIYQGAMLTCSRVEDHFAELCFNATDDYVNKFNYKTMMEFNEALDAVAADDSLKGLMLTSDKESFIVGADITEFLFYFSQPLEELHEGMKMQHGIFNKLEDLNMPTVVAINGYALGGGLEVSLCADYRIAEPGARIGLPEVKLGIIPGLGGTTRLPRLIGADNAIEWIAAGSENKAEDARAIGVLDGVVPVDKLKSAALSVLKNCDAGHFNWQARRAEKKGPLQLNQIEGMMSFETAKAFIAGKAGPHYPAPVRAVKVIQAAAGMSRDEALEVERQGFMKVAKTDVAQNLIGIFINDQYLKKIAKKQGKIAQDVKTAAVLGAGIMGGGIAYQAVSRGKTPVIMKDIRPEALELGLTEASKLLGKLVKRGKFTPDKMAAALNMIQPTLSYGDMGRVDMVIEAVIENEKIKKSVLAELEETVSEKAVIASNTSTISITRLAEGLKRPERFVGMHFFNPVHKMPLVEVIRGEKSSDAAIATTVAFAQKMGKNPIVVNDCPGFLVNRILFPYFAGFNFLLGAGADFVKVDKVLEGFGWPMGPAYLNDVVGMDTAHHAEAVMAEGFPDRMGRDHKTVLDVMFENKRFGQKTGSGFYKYELDKKGRLKKVKDPEAAALIRSLIPEPREFSDEEIIDHLMLPMIIESSRCLEDGIVNSPAELDMGLVYGIGFPPFRGGALKYADSLGLAAVCEKAKAYAHYGKLFEPTDRMKDMAKSGQSYYQ